MENVNAEALGGKLILQTNLQIQICKYRTYVEFDEGIIDMR